MWVTAAALHFDKNADKWLQVYKKTNPDATWDQFADAVESQFGQYALLDPKQCGSVEEYATQFEDLYYKINMHHSGYDPVFFISQFINGLKHDIQLAVQTQVLPTLHYAIMLAKLQERVLDRGKDKFQKSQLTSAGVSYASKE